MLGIYLQASCIISCIFAVFISIAWFYTEPILIFLQQEPEISKTAALYIKYLIPGLFAYGFVQNILRFLQTQSILMPLVWFSVLSLGIHLGIVYSLVNWIGLGIKGAALATSISIWISFLLLAIYVLFAKKFEQTWEGLSLESFRYIVANLKLALPSAAMVWWVHFPIYVWFNFYLWKSCWKDSDMLKPCFNFLQVWNIGHLSFLCC